MKNNQISEILVSAYTCSPNWGSEPGMSWHWIKNLSKYYKIHLITSCEFKAELMNGLKDFNLEDSIIVYFNDIGQKAMNMGKNQGDWRFYYYYEKWQRKTYKIALQIVRDNNIVLVHQLNMIGFREPGYLWKLDKPTVWGPIGGMNYVPNSFLKNIDFRQKLKLKLKNSITKFQLEYSPRVQKAFSKHEVIIAANINSKIEVKKYLKKDIPVLNETGSYATFNTDENLLERFDSENFNILWVGKDLFTKQLELALRIIANVKDIPGLKFHIVGVAKNTDTYIKHDKIIKNLNIEGIVEWHGMVKNKEVKNMMQKHQLFLFTSIVEGTPHVILEAIEHSLPILCFNYCGQGECVNESVGQKIELSTPANAIRDFSIAIKDLFNNKDKLIWYSKNGVKRSEELSWDSKIKTMSKYYKEAIQKFEAKKTK